MRRSIVAFVLAAMVGLSSAALAQQQPPNNEQRDPDEYSQEDSHPLRLISYVLAPIGYALEWTIMRPLHHLATDTAAAPAMSGDLDYMPKSPNPAPVAELPASRPMALSPAPAAIPPPAETASTLHEESIAPPASNPAPSVSQHQTPTQQPATPPGQAVIH